MFLEDSAETEIPKLPKLKFWKIKKPKTKLKTINPVRENDQNFWYRGLSFSLAFWWHFDFFTGFKRIR